MFILEHLITLQAHAQDLGGGNGPFNSSGGVDQLLSKIAENIINPFIILLFVFALVIFLWGVLQFVMKADDEEARKIGRRHMIYGILGMALMVSAFGVVRFIANTIQADNSVIDQIQR